MSFSQLQISVPSVGAAANSPQWKEAVVNGQWALVAPHEGAVAFLPEVFRFVETQLGVVGVFDRAGGRQIELLWLPLTADDQVQIIPYDSWR